MLDQLVNSTLKEIENERYFIHNIINKALRIAQQRKDLNEFIYLKFNKSSLLNDEEIVGIYEELKPISKEMNFSIEQYREVFVEVEKLYKQQRMVDWYVSESKGVVNDYIVSLSVSELTNNITQLELLLEKNLIPEGLATLDLYHENIKKRKIDSIYLNQLGACKTILNNIRDFLFDYLMDVESDILKVEESIAMTTQEKLELLIEDGYKAKEKCFVRNDFGLDYISGVEYVTWVEESKQFIKNYVHDSEIKTNFFRIADRANSNSLANFTQMIGILTALKKYDFKPVAILPAEKEDVKIDKIFISHSSKDIEYVDALVTMLNAIGIKRSNKHIFCSSLPNYGIPYGESIYDFLKQELNKENIMVLFVLSDNYYDSAPCLNEMGAAWITSKQHNSVLTPNFDFRKIAGAIDPTKISFRMNDSDGVNNFRDTLIKIFELEEVDYKLWEQDRNIFLEKVNLISDAEKKNLNTQVHLENVRKIEEEVELQFRFVNITEREIEFKYIDIELFDKLGNKFHTSIEDSILDEFRLHPKENKVIKWRVKNDTSYNARRDDREKSKVTFEI